MTNHPRYSPPPQQHGHRPVSRSARGHRPFQPGQQQPIRRATTGVTASSPSRQYRQPYGPFAGVRPGLPRWSRASASRSVAKAFSRRRYSPSARLRLRWSRPVSAAGSRSRAAAPRTAATVADGPHRVAAPGHAGREPARRLRVEQVAAKVVPSVVKLETNLGQAVRRGLRHHPVLGRLDPDEQSRRGHRGERTATAGAGESRPTTVTFSRRSHRAVHRRWHRPDVPTSRSFACRASRDLTPITIGSSSQPAWSARTWWRSVHRWVWKAP